MIKLIFGLLCVAVATTLVITLLTVSLPLGTAAFIGLEALLLMVFGKKSGAQS